MVRERGPADFGKEWRMGRFNRAVVQRLALEITAAEAPVSPEEKAEAVKLLDRAVFSLYTEIIDQGDPEEQSVARERVGLMAECLQSESWRDVIRNRPDEPPTSS